MDQPRNDPLVGDCRGAWKALRRLERWHLAIQIGVSLIPIGLLLACLDVPEPLGSSMILPWIGLAVLLPFPLWLWAIRHRIESFDCPRCGHLFNKPKYGALLIGTDRCRHCGLKKWEECELSQEAVAAQSDDAQKSN